MKIKDLSSNKIKEYAKYFNPEDLWKKLKKYSLKLGKELVYYILLLYFAMKSPQTPFMHKVMIAGALGYLIFPLDFIPDSVPILGFSDDFAAISLILKKVNGSITPEVEKLARETVSKWFEGKEIEKKDLIDDNPVI